MLWKYNLLKKYGYDAKNLESTDIGVCKVPRDKKAITYLIIYLFWEFTGFVDFKRKLYSWQTFEDYSCKPMNSYFNHILS